MRTDGAFVKALHSAAAPQPKNGGFEPSRMTKSQIPNTKEFRGEEHGVWAQRSQRGAWTLNQGVAGALVSSCSRRKFLSVCAWDSRGRPSSLLATTRPVPSTLKEPRLDQSAFAKKATARPAGVKGNPSLDGTLFTHAFQPHSAFGHLRLTGRLEQKRGSKARSRNRYRELGSPAREAERATGNVYDLTERIGKARGLNSFEGK
jgi:hypothetical protein